MLSQVFPLETYHRDKHFILHLYDWQPNTRYTPLTSQTTLPGMCDCVHLTVADTHFDPLQHICS